MRKLGGTDASFLYSETINAPQHVGGIQYLDVPEALRAGFARKLRKLVLDRIHLLPYLTNRLQPMPFEIDHPVWVRHTAFDIDEHFHRVRVDAPGAIEQVERLAADIYEPLLERDKPLWEMWVIEGLANGQIAVLSKTHHACLDGMASIAVQEILGDYEPAPRKVAPAPASFWDEEPSDYATLMRESWFNLARYAVQQWAQWPAQVAANTRLQQRRNRDAAEQPTSAAKAPWNAPITARRGLAGATFSLSTLKAIGKATGTKVNDVILAITADALNRYLALQGVEFDGAMIAGCPVSLRKPGDQSMNNQVTMMSVSLQNHVADPIQRLQAIHRSATAAKEWVADLGDSIQTDFGAAFLPARLRAMVQADPSGAQVQASEQVPVNVVVSNVPGLQTPVYSAGARVVGTTPCSIVSHGAGLNVTVSSYLDRMDLGLTAASNVIPDIVRLRNEFVKAYDVLAAIALGHGQNLMPAPAITEIVRVAEPIAEPPAQAA